MSGYSWNISTNRQAATYHWGQEKQSFIIPLSLKARLIEFIHKTKTRAVAIIPKTPGIHHIGLRSTDFSVTKNFYRDIIGFPLVVDRPDLIIFAAGSVYIAFKKAEPRDKNYSFFSPFEVGLDHIAMTCESEEELARFANGLVDAGIENTGVKLDTALNKLYVAFKDPDRIQWEFYMK